MSQQNPKSIKRDEVDEDDFSKINPRESFLPIGVRLRTKGEDGNWLALDRDDWVFLHKVLAGKLDGIRACDVSNPLRVLAKYAKAMVEWYDRTKQVSRE